MESKEYADTYDKKYSGFKKYHHESENLNKIIKKFVKSDDCSIIDLACGTGTHAIEVAKYGYNVTGLDLNPDILLIAREKASARGRNVTFAEGSFLDYKSKEKYDVVINLFYSFQNVCITDKEIKNFFHTVSCLMKKNGIFIIEILPEENSISNYGTNKLNIVSNTTESNGVNRIISTISNLPDSRGIRRIDIIVEEFLDGVQTSKKKSKSYMKAYASKDLSRLFEDNHFEVLKTYGCLSDLRQYNYQEKKMVVVCRKKIRNG